MGMWDNYTKIMSGSGDWDDFSDFMSGGGRSDVNRGYDESNKYMEPWRKGGLEDYQRSRDFNQQRGNELSKYGNPADWAYKHAGMSPQDFYKEMMGSYDESPEAKYAQEQAMKGSAYGASASGMMGSGAFMKGLQENSNGISQRDRQQYFNNVLKGNDQQMGYLQNFQGRQDRYQDELNRSAGHGYNASTHMSGNAVNRGKANAEFDGKAFEDLMAMFRAAAGGMK